MECLLQYLDEIDDLFGVVGLYYEGFRNAVLALLSLIVGLVAVASAVALALAHPPIALATSILLFLTLLYRSVTSPYREQPRSV